MILRTRSAARRAARGGFTLLEILLASLIGGLLLAALYAAMYTTLLQTQLARDAVEAEDLSRGVFNKISNDLTGTLAPLPPKSGGNAAGSGGTTVAPAAGTTPTDGSTAAAGAAPTDGSAAPAAADPAAADPAATDASMPGATDNATAVSADYAFQGGVIGEETKLVIYAGRVPEAFGRYGDTGQQVRADQRQIMYWLEPGRGLFRRERPWVTADGVRNSIETDADAPESVLLAEEVTGLLFEFSDGTSWTSTWDGTVPGPDGVTPLGPPRAIRVTLDLRVGAGNKSEPVIKPVSQVIVVRSAPGTYTPPLLEAPTDGATDGSGTTTGDASSSGGMSSTGGGTTGNGSGGATGGGTGAKSGGGTGGSTGGGSTGGAGAPSGGKSGGGTGGTGGGASGGGRTGGTGGSTGGKR